MPSRSSRTTRSNNQSKRSSAKRETRSNINRDLTQNEKIKLLTIIILIVLGLIFLGWFLTLVLCLGFGLIYGTLKKLTNLKNKKQKKVVTGLLLAFLTLCIIGTAGLCLFMGYIVISAPKFEKSKLNQKESTILYDSDGKEFAKLGTEMRENVSYNDLSESLVNALIATEDSRFFEHNGLDVPRFIKASVKQVLGQPNAGGASTLSMQVIKNSFTSTEASGIKGIVRKFTDIYLAVFKLEKSYTKQEIVEFYVNNHYLGNNSYGVEQASQLYFGKSVSDLNTAEAALLVGMFKAPSQYDPYTHPEAAEKRRATVLYLMRKHGYITKEEESIANSIPVSSLLSEKKNIATNEYQAFIDTVVEEVVDTYDLDPYSTPMVIYTTMDRSKQQGINDIMNGKTFTWKDDKIQSGIAVLNIHNGRILAVGAGRNREGARSYNYATMLERQPGSTAKPIIDYGPAIEYNNWSTYTMLDDTPYSYSSGASLHNWDNGYMGPLTLREALRESRNIPALRTFQSTTIEQKLKFAKSLGIDPTANDGNLYESASIGAFQKGVSPLKMAAAFAAFGNGGYYYSPHSYTKIVLRDSDETLEPDETGTQVMSDSTAYMITNVLQGVPSNMSAVSGVKMAAKTGTTNYTEEDVEKYGLPQDVVNDGWTIAYDPDIVFGMWYGYDKINSEYYSRMTEQAIARDRLVHTIGTTIFEKKNKDFTMPSSVVKVGVEIGSNPAALPSPTTPENKIIYELFKKGSEPTETSEKYSKLENPGFLHVEYNENTDTVTLTWGAVTPVNKKDEYGPFGYFVYYNGTQLGFTENTKYTIKNPTTPEGTYKVIASFKKHTENQSTGVTAEYSLPKEELSYTVGIPNSIRVNDLNEATDALAKQNITITDSNNNVITDYTLVQKSKVDNVNTRVITYDIKISGKVIETIELTFTTN
ncbi:MAG: transglycosylase domain-containing protein [Bacilli bacterium]